MSSTRLKIAFNFSLPVLICFAGYTGYKLSIENTNDAKGNLEKEKKKNLQEGLREKEKLKKKIEELKKALSKEKHREEIKQKEKLALESQLEGFLSYASINLFPTLFKFSHPLFYTPNLILSEFCHYLIL